ncbi:MAG: DNA-3-methyladenine glycosylase 2 family protein [Euryarchaeota archaeon]|jgi:DNA-3-methyladenine glycosylase II
MLKAGSTPEWWGSAKLELANKDDLLKSLIEEFEEPRLSSRGDLFATLIKSIVGQQISVIAASAVWSRLFELVGEVNPESILAKTHEELRQVGLSNRKVEYIVGIAEAWTEGLSEIDWEQMSDEEVVQELVKLRGVGRWTVQMLLIFALLRQDVFPIDDIGLIRGMEKLYNSGNPLENSELYEISEKWMPYRTMGVWYIWRSIDPEPVEY